MDFLKNQSKDIDIFCLQEIYKNKKPIIPFEIKAKQTLFYDIEKIISNFNGFYSSFQDDNQGMAIFSKKSIDVKNYGDLFVLRHKNAMTDWRWDTIGKTIQWIKFIKDNKKFTVINFHGVGGGKEDRPDRIEQSNNIKKFLNNIEGEIIMCGDFNVNPNTKSLAIIEEGMKNLIKEYNITSTRTKFYSGYDGKTEFADYILISKGIKVLDFKVLPDEVSDHSPIYFEFD
jgi:exonuclease III